jgi:hypothetical protein
LRRVDLRGEKRSFAFGGAKKKKIVHGDVLKSARSSNPRGSPSRVVSLNPGDGSYGAKPARADLTAFAR